MLAWVAPRGSFKFLVSIFELPAPPAGCLKRQKKSPPSLPFLRRQTFMFNLSPHKIDFSGKVDKLTLWMKDMVQAQSDIQKPAKCGPA